MTRRIGSRPWSLVGVIDIVKFIFKYQGSVGFQKVTSELRASTQHTDRLKDHVAKVEEDLSKARNHIDELVKTAAADSLRWQEQDQNRQQTISLLVSEKASFSSSLQRLEDVEKGTTSF